MKHSCKKRGGFTILELIIVILLTGILAAGTGLVLREAMSVYSFKKNTMSLREEGQSALQKFSLEFRQARSVTFTSATDISITGDFDGDGATEVIRYFRSGSQFRRLAISTSVLCANVTNLDFSWSSPYVAVSMSLSKGQETVHLRTGVAAKSLL